MKPINKNTKNIFNNIQEDFKKLNIPFEDTGTGVLWSPCLFSNSTKDNKALIWVQIMGDDIYYGVDGMNEFDYHIPATKLFDYHSAFSEMARFYFENID